MRNVKNKFIVLTIISAIVLFGLILYVIQFDPKEMIKSTRKIVLNVDYQREGAYQHALKKEFIIEDPNVISALINNLDFVKSSPCDCRHIWKGTYFTKNENITTTFNTHCMNILKPKKRHYDTPKNFLYNIKLITQLNEKYYY